MLGSILDYLYVISENRSGEIPKEIQHIQTSGEDAENWICFLPEGVLKFSHTRKRILSMRNCDVYVLPRNAIQPNPESTKELLEKITENAINNYSEKREKINILGVSLGNAPAYKFANAFPVNQFVSVAPGSFLPECVWESIATRRIAENSRETLDDYREALDDFSPIRNLDNLGANSLEVYLGKCDKMIPYKRGKELVDEMKKRELNPRTTIFPASGHCETILFFAKSFAISQW